MPVPYRACRFSDRHKFPLTKMQLTFFFLIGFSLTYNCEQSVIVSDYVLEPLVGVVPILLPFRQLLFTASEAPVVVAKYLAG